MAVASVTVRMDPAAIQAMLKGDTGPVLVDLRRRADRVRNKAVTLCPVDTGVLRGSISVEIIHDASGPVARVGTSVPYARYVEEGTGIYGPRGTPIRPIRGRFLRWPATNNAYVATGGPRRYKAGRTARFIYARQVRGRKATPFLGPALDAAAG